MAVGGVGSEAVFVQAVVTQARLNELGLCGDPKPGQQF